MTALPSPDVALMSFWVEGTPRAQPRPRFSRATGSVVSTLDPKVRAWRGAVAAAAVRSMAASGGRPAARPRKADGRTTYDPALAVAVSLSFRFKAPEKKRLGQAMISKPDLDNLAKAVLDEMADQGALPDGDACVARLECEKAYGEREGVFVEVRRFAPRGL